MVFTFKSLDRNLLITRQLFINITILSDIFLRCSASATHFLTKVWIPCLLFVVEFFFSMSLRCFSKRKLVSISSSALLKLSMNILSDSDVWIWFVCLSPRPGLLTEGNFLIFKPKPDPIHSQSAETLRESNIWICSLAFLFLHVSLNIRFKTLDSTLDF